MKRPQDEVRLSAAHDLFLEFVGRNPEALDRASFGPLLDLDEIFPYPVQLWPIFMGESRRRAFARAAVAISRLVRSVPTRVFENDPVRLSEYYGYDVAQMQILSALLGTTDILDEAFGRGDFLLTADERLRCLEFNMAGSIGGIWEPMVWRERYLNVPVIRRFLEESGIVPDYTNSMEIMFEHVVERCRDLARDGALALAITAPDDALPARSWVDQVRLAYEAVLARHGLDGTLSAAPLDAFSERGGELRLEGRRIHVLFEGFLGLVSGPVVRAMMSGRVRVYNGPVTRILSDKQNIALLSELSGSDLFTEEERRDIDLYIPWTRRLEPEFTSWGDDRVYLPDLVLAERGRFVLKPCNELGGEGLLIGNRTEPAVWDAAVETALGARGWLVQEVVEPSCHLLQAGDSGCAPYRPVWGLFSFGDTYGGVFVRMAPAAEPSGVINAKRGALLGLILDVPDELAVCP